MNCRELLGVARGRGIEIRLDDVGDVKVGGNYTDQFLTWLKANKADVVAELRKPKDLNALLDAARAGTDFTLKECRSGFLFSPLDLQLIQTGELTVAAANHFLRHVPRETCRGCLGSGCKQCDYFGKTTAAPYRIGDEC